MVTGENAKTTGEHELEYCMHSHFGECTGDPFMSATALQLNLEPIADECHQRKVQALADIVTRHSPRLYRIAANRLNNVADAEDAVQDALLSALRHVQHFRGQAKMSTWLTTIVINSARMKLRKRLVSVQLALDEMDGRQDLMLGKHCSGY